MSDRDDRTNEAVGAGGAVNAPVFSNWSINDLVWAASFPEQWKTKRSKFELTQMSMLGASVSTADGGRVHRMHQDDSDLTLAVAVGGPWRGADLTYARDAAGRPGTPEPGGRGVEAATHAHAPGRGVVHVGDAYHRVEPLASGARGTLVLMSMRDDAAWKRRYYDDDGD